MSDAREAWCAATMFSGSLCTRPAGHEGHHFRRDPWAEGSPAPREALVALIEQNGCLPPSDAEDIADAILAAGWTPPGERVKPSVEDVARAILMVTQAADVDPDYAWNVQYPEVQDECLDQARAVLALLPGRTETEVRREAWDEVADYLDRTNAPSLAEAARRDNPYRKEARRG